jgi:hypothetical protein
VPHLSLSNGSARLCAVLALFTFGIMAPSAHGAPDAFFDLGTAPPAEVDSDTLPVELGMRLTVATPFRADGIAFYRSPSMPLANARVRLWKRYERIAIGVADSTARSGWVRVTFEGGPVTLQPNTEYVASYSAPAGGYVATNGFFIHPLAPAGTVLRTPTDAGVYRYYDLVAPGYTWEHSNYWVTPYGEALPPSEEPPVSNGPWALFDAGTPIDNPVTSDPDRVELGTRFSVSAPTTGDYYVSAIRVYRGSPMPELRVSLYDDAGVVVGRGEIIGEGGREGLNEVVLREPVKLRPGVTYTAAYDAKWGRYAELQHGFDAARTVGPITFHAGAGVYQYGGGFPTETWEGSSYYVSPVVVATPAR